MPGGHHRIGRQAVDRRLVQQEEEGARTADAVVLVGPVQPGARHLRHALPRPLPQLVQRAELNRCGRARLRARGRLSVQQAVVAERALPHPTVALALVDDAERAGGHAVAAAIADVLLHDDGAELGAEQRPGGAHLQAACPRAVLAHVGGHEPPHAAALCPEYRLSGIRTAGTRDKPLLHEGHVPPGVGAQRPGVVVRLAGERQAVDGHVVPLLARHLARLAPDADRGVGEEAHPGRGRGRHRHRGRRPGRMSHVAALTSWMWALGSSTTANRSLAASPVESPRLPQWYGSPTWCSSRPWTTSGAMRSVTNTRASMAARTVVTVAHPPLTRPRSAASAGLTSQNMAGCSSDSTPRNRLMPPAAWCSVSR